MPEVDLHDLSDAAIANMSVKQGMGGGTATSIFGSFSGNDQLAVIGVITTALGFCVNLYYQHRRDIRAKEEFDLKKKLLEAQIKNEQEGSR